MSEHWTDANTVALNQLCAHFGIATEYHDIWGTRQLVAREGLLALLCEFDIVLDGPGSAEGALAAARRATWRQTLPAVLAIRGTAPEWGLSLRLPASMTLIRWRLSDETGARLEGEVDTATLPEAARTELDGVLW